MAASVSLQIKSNFDEAEQEFKSFSETAFKETEKVKKALGKVEAKQLDAVIDKHQRLATAVTATRGKQEAFIVQQRNLRNEIEKQIRMGLDPQDERLKKIRAEYTRVTEKVEENRAATKKQKEALKLQSKALKDQEDQVKKNKIAQEQMNAVLQRSYMALLAGVGLTTAALAKNTFEVAKNGDEYAKQGSILGVTAEEYQELAFAADRSGVEMGTLTSAIAGMNRRIGEARNGTGALVTALKDSNPQLLEQLKSAKGTSEAFDIMTTAMANTTDVQDRAALSAAAFGRKGMELVNMTKDGAEGIKELREEAQKYGVISNEAARQSELFLDSQANLSASVTGLKNRLGAELIPMFDNTVNAMTDFIGSFDDSEIEQFGESVKFIFNGLLLAGGVVAKGMNDVFSLANANIDQSVKNTFKVVQKISDFVATQAESWSTVLDFLGADVTGLKNMANSVRSFEQTMAGAEVATRKSQEESVLSWERRNAVIVEYMKTIDKALTAEEKVGSGGGGGGGAGDGGGETPEAMREKIQLLTEEELNGYDIRTEQLLHFYDNQILSTEELNARMDLMRKDQAEKERLSSEARLATAERGLSGAASISSSLKKIMRDDAKAQRALAIVDKGIAIARIAIDTQRAIAASIAITPLPAGAPAAVANGAVGLAAGIAVAAEPIPTAETGANFVVPDTGGISRVDNVAVHAQPGENVNITPRGESSKSMTSVVVKLDSRVILEVAQEGIDSGELLITTDNVRAA